MYEKVNKKKEYSLNWYRINNELKRRGIVETILKMFRNSECYVWQTLFLSQLQIYCPRKWDLRIQNSFRKFANAFAVDFVNMDSFANRQNQVRKYTNVN